VDQYVDSRQKEILWNLLANPADTGSSYIPSLERLVHDNPQSGILQVLLARAGDKQQLSKAAIYYNPRTLYKLVNHPESLAAVKSAGIPTLSDNILPDDHQSYLKDDSAIEEKAAGTEEVNNNDQHEEAVEANEPQTAPVPDAYQTEDSSDITNGHVITEPVITYDTLETAAVSEQETEAEPVTEQFVREVSEAPDTNNETGHIYHPFENSETEQIAGEEPVADTAPPLEEEKTGNDSKSTNSDLENIDAQQPEYLQNDIEDEVYDEIVSIEDIGFEAIANEGYTAPIEARFSDPYVESGPEEEEASSVLFHQPQPETEPVPTYNQSIHDQEERLILGGIVNADYLSFDKKLDELRNSAASAGHTDAVTEQPQQAAPPADTQEVSRYDDDKMPYSFMWWLNKTRKEHASSFQPYASSAETDKPVGTEPNGTAKIGAADELQQQYYENIFSLTSVSAIERVTDAAKVEFDHTKKEDVIIERFIHTEPQIKPQSADKLDNENKAKKSSEDQNELVTETLARIYYDQMLYHKAIATYKKLILKFPEKKLYFASQIEQLEKKTN
jgi:hypothetical protein